MGFNLSSLEDCAVLLHLSEVGGALALIEAVFLVFFGLLLLNAGFEVPHNVNEAQHGFFGVCVHFHLEGVDQSAPELVGIDLPEDGEILSSGERD